MLLSAVDVSRHFRGPRSLLTGRREPPVRAVDGISLDIAGGASVGLVGESGSGKSTLARLMLMLDRPTSGEIRYRGRGTGRLTPAERAGFRREIQPVPQDPFQSLDPRMRVGRIVAEPLRARGSLTRADIETRTHAALERVDLRASDAGRRPIDFSGGQRQRIAIARALVSNPKLIILDEAVSSQDVSIRAQLLNLLKDIRDEAGVAYLFISHDLTTVSFLCDAVAVMHRGRVVETGPTADVFAKPAHAYTASLLDAWLPPVPALARARLKQQ